MGSGLGRSVQHIHVYETSGKCYQPQARSTRPSDHEMLRDVARGPHSKVHMCVIDGSLECFVTKAQRIVHLAKSKIGLE